LNLSEDFVRSGKFYKFDFYNCFFLFYVRGFLMKNVFVKLFVPILLIGFIGMTTIALADNNNTTVSKDTKSKVVSSKDSKACCSKACMEKCKKEGKDCSKDCKTKCMKNIKHSSKLKGNKSKATKAKDAPSELK
jgi:hypothetical protein